MRGSYVPLSSSSSLQDAFNTMERQQDDSYLRQPLLLGEPYGYVDSQAACYRSFQGLNDHTFAMSRKMPIDPSHNGASALNAALSINPFQSNGYADTWRYQDAVRARDRSLRTDFQFSPSGYPNQEFVSPTPPNLHGPYNITESSDVEASKEDIVSSTNSHIDSSPVMQVWPPVREKPITAFRSGTILPLKDGQEDEEGSGDKPYARLIHEALMQAPGHRMMLREIYDWFVRNTTKPSESGTNGWQNSIRHNLSMNQVSLHN